MFLALCVIIGVVVGTTQLDMVACLWVGERALQNSPPHWLFTVRLCCLAAFFCVGARVLHGSCWQGTLLTWLC
jgi:hypothetical protein